MSSKKWIFYILINKKCTYAGISLDPIRRLRQHNSEITGGAKYTTSRSPGWTHLCYVEGFRTHREALQFEWAVKHCSPRNLKGITGRILKLNTILCKTKWTKLSPDACDIILNLTWKNNYSYDLKSLPSHVNITNIPNI